MVRIRRLVIICCMTSRTGIRCIVIIAVVAGSTIIGNCSVRPVQGIVIIVNRESSRIPAGCCCMTHFTVSRYTERHVIRVGRLIEIGGVAAGAGIRRIRVIAVVTGITIVGYLYMCPGKGINHIVIKSGRCPGCFGMTRRTFRWKLRGRMVRIRRLVVIRRMTTVTSIRCIIVIPVVTGGAIIVY